MTPFIEAYLKLFGDTECPKIYLLWSAISASAAMLSRNIWFKHGSKTIYPNLYIMLIGDPGARKSTAIKGAKELVEKTGYESFAPNRSTKEKFLQDFEKGFTFDSDAVVSEEDLEHFLNEDVETITREVYISADEWLEFFGEANTGFATVLGSMWDFNGLYRDRLKNSKSVTIPNPTVNLFGGATHETFKLAFPSTLLGHGFLSRMLLIYGEQSGKLITWPREITEVEMHPVVEQLSELRHKLYGQAKVSADGMEMLDSVYQQWGGVDDIRFKHYSTRRFSQLLKLCLIVVAHRGQLSVESEDVLIANTILTHAEQFMPKALGEFGANKNSAVMQKVVNILDAATRPVTLKELWKQCSRDLESDNELVKILQNLAGADKIMNIGGKGFLPKKVVKKDISGLTDMKRLEQLLSV